MAARPTIIVPVKPFAQGKTRLAPVLCASARADVARQLCVHVLSVLSSLRGACDTIVVSRSAEVLALARERRLRGMAEQGHDLNAAVRQAMMGTGAGPVVVLCADLPRLARSDVAALLATRSHDVIVAPDVDGTGTNALRLARAGLIAPQFGPGSHAAHRAAAVAAGLGCASVTIPGLAADLDTPDDLGLLRPARGQLACMSAMAGQGGRIR